MQHQPSFSWRPAAPGIPLLPPTVQETNTHYPENAQHSSFANHVSPLRTLKFTIGNYCHISPHHVTRLPRNSWHVSLHSTSHLTIAKLISREPTQCFTTINREFMSRERTQHITCHKRQAHISWAHTVHRDLRSPNSCRMRPHSASRFTIA